MDPEEARRRFEGGAVLVVLDMPPGTEFGMDYTSWRVGQRFRGVKMIPPGMHLVHFAAVGNTETGAPYTAPRTSFFLSMEARQIVVCRWDTETEDLIVQQLDNEELGRFRAGLLELEPSLGAYPWDDSLKRWISLSSHITPDVCARLDPEGGKIASTDGAEQAQPFRSSRSAKRAAAEEAAASTATAHAAAGGQHAASTPMATSEAETDSEAHMMTPAEAEEAAARSPEVHSIRFTPIPKHMYPPGASPAEITKHTLDKSYLLAHLLKEHYNLDHKSLLGEMQYAFVTFLIGQVFSGFEQWKQLVALCCQCEDALSTHPKLFHEFIGVLHFHLKETPTDFFVDIVSRDNFLTTTLQTFFEIALDNGAIDPALRERTAKFKALVEERFGWDFDIEPDDEDQPVVVDLNE